MAKNSVYKFEKKNIQGGAGRLIIGTDITKRPTSISDVMDPNTYELVGGYRDLGATTDGISQSRGFDTSDVEIDQSTTPISTTISSWTNTISTTLMESTIENRQLAFIGGTIEETPAAYGAGVALASTVVKGATSVNVADGASFANVKFVKIGDEIVQVASISGSVIKLKKPLEKSYTTSDKAAPVTKLGTKTISYGSPANIPSYQLVLISQKDDGTLLMVVYYEVKSSGDSSEMSYNKEKRQIPIGFTVYAQDDLPEDENVFKEIEEVL